LACFYKLRLEWLKNGGGTGVAFISLSLGHDLQNYPRLRFFNKTKSISEKIKNRIPKEKKQGIN